MIFLRIVRIVSWPRLDDNLYMVINSSYFGKKVLTPLVLSHLIKVVPFIEYICKQVFAGNYSQQETPFLVNVSKATLELTFKSGAAIFFSFLTQAHLSNFLTIQYLAHLLVLSTDQRSRNGE